MADQRITELVELTQVGTASNDVLPIADVSASQTKKIQVKSLIQAGFNLADASTLDISKINQSSTAKFNTSAFADNAVSYAKIQDVSATNRLLGRSSAGAGSIEEIVCTSFARTILDDADASTARSTLGLGAVATGSTINTSLLENDSVTNAKIAAGAVDTTELANDSVTSAKIDAGAVDTTALGSSSVTLAKMAANSVSTTQVVDSGITQPKLASNAVATVNIADSGVTQPKLAADAVATVNIADSGVTQSKLAANAVDTVNIVDSGITQPKLAADAVATVNIVDSGVTLAKMASNSVNTSQLVDSGITQPKLASGSVNTINLVDSGVTQPKLAANAVDTINVAALAITNAKIANSTIEASKLNLASGSIDGAVISGSSIPSGVFASGVIVDSDIADNTVTFSKLQEVATDVLVGRSTAGSGSLETITLTSAGRALLDDASAAAQRTTLGLGTLATQNGTFSGTSSGTNTGDQTIVLTGDVTGSGTGTFTATISSGVVDTNELAALSVTTAKLASNSVSFAKIQNINTSTLLGRSTAGSGNVEEITCTSAGRALLDDADAAAQRTTLGLGTLATQNGTFSGTSSGTNTGDQTIVLTGDVTGSGTGTFAATISSGVVDTTELANDAVTYEKFQNIPTNTLLGRSSAATGVVEEISCTAAGFALLDDADAATQRTTLGLGTIATRNTIASGDYDAGSIATSDIGDSQVTTAKIVNSGITSVKIADDAVTTNKIANANITQAKMASGSVNTAQLVNSGVTQAKLASDAVDTINIADSAVVNAKIANSTIGAEKLNLASGTIDGSVISGNTILSGSFASGVINTEDIADNAVTFAKMQQVASGVLIGRATAGSGNLETITLTSAGRALLDDTDASAQRTTLGLGSIATQNASGVAITGGTAILSSGTFSYAAINGGVISGITDLAIADGGTGASTASGARANLGLAIGSDVQAYSAVLSGVSEQFTTANTLIYASASGIVSSAPLTSFGRSIVSGSTASGVRSTLGLGTISTQDNGNVTISGGAISGVTLTTGSVTISGGTISGITDLAIADGGTGASNASDARDNLGLTIGSGVQAYSSVLSGVSEQFTTADTLIYASASGVVSSADFTSFGRSIVSGSTASGVRSTLGLGTIATQDASNVSITGGAVSGVTLTTGSVTISGGTISGITDLAIADGGTGASTASGARTNLGLSIGSDVQAYDAGLQSIAGLTTASGQIIYTTGSDTYATSTITAAGRALIDDASATAQRTTLGLGSLAIQNTVASGDYDAGSIATADIANNAITTAKIVDSGITTAKIVDGNITTAKINDSAITTAKIADSGVTTVKIASGAVTLAKITPTTQSDVILGRATASGGVLEEIACTAAARSILDDVSVEDIRETLGLGTLATQDGTFTGTSTGTNTGDQTITLTGDVTGTGTGSFAATIANNAVTTAKINAGAVTTAKIADSGVTALKLAGQSTVIVTNSTPVGSGTYIGQQWLNTSTAYEYTWNGSSWLRQAALNTATISGDSVYSFSTNYPDNFSAVISPSLNTQSANAVFIGPASGSDAAPTFRALTGADLPTATSGTTGVMRPGAGLVMNGDQIDHSNSIASGIFYKVVVDGQGHVSSGATALVAADIPVLSASKITTGTFGSGFIADNSINGEKLADYSVTKFGETTPLAQFTGQFFFNPLEKDLFLWDGNVWNPVGISIGEIVFAGTYNASGNTIATVSAEGSAAGLTIGQPLPSPSATFNRYYVVVESGGTGTSPAPETELNPPDLLLCNGTAWVEIDVSSTYTSQTATQIGFTPAANVSSTNVQAAIEEVSTECRNANNIASGILNETYGGTGQSSYTKGDLIAASGATDLGLVSVGTNGQVLTADSTQDTGLTWTTPSSGTVLSVTVGAPMSVTSGTTTPNITISGATTAGSGVVQLTDSTSTTSSTLAATATAVKSAYDLANAALPKAGGVITGTVTFGTTGVLAFEGASDDAYEITLAAANATADQTVTLPDVTGTVVTTGDNGTVTNTMLAGSIADTKLNTISTTGKVDNSATTATSANTASAIVARDGSGDFSAGIISATIDEGSF